MDQEGKLWIEQPLTGVFRTPALWLYMLAEITCDVQCWLRFGCGVDKVG